MAKKKAAKKGAKKTAAKAAKKSVKKASAKSAKKSTKKTAAKKSVKKSIKKSTKKAPAIVMSTAAMRDVQPKRPRRTMQSAPPSTGAVINVGDVAPDFTLEDGEGASHTLSDYRGQSVVLYFYPKDDTPGCTIQACGFRDTMDAFTDRNAVVLGISPDSPSSHQKFSMKFGLPFPLLADEDHGVAEKYGVWVEKSMYGKNYMGTARTTFIIGPSGTITHVFRSVQPEGHQNEVLMALGG